MDPIQRSAKALVTGVRTGVLRCLTPSVRKTSSKGAGCGHPITLAHKRVARSDHAAHNGPTAALDIRTSRTPLTEDPAFRELPSRLPPPSQGLKAVPRGPQPL